MRLSVRNCAKIKSADIVIDGLTVIAGANNTGKSTIGKILFSFFNAMNDIDSKILEERKREIVSACRLHLSDFGDVSETRELVYRRGDIIGRRIANNVCTPSYEEVTEKELEEIIHVALSKFFSKEMSGNEEYNNLIEKCIDSIQSISAISQEVLSKEVLTRYFTNVFRGQINSLYGEAESAELCVEIKGKSVELRFDDNRCVECISPLSIIHKAIYIDNPFVLDSLDRFSDLSMMDRFLKRLLLEESERDVMDGLIESVRAQGKLEEINEVLERVVDGNILRDKGDEYFLKEEAFEKPIAFNNLSTGLKAFVLIKMLLEKGIIKDKDVLILDEPEIHLHPEWQIAYAELIVLIQKYFDLSVVMATHSPYFVDAINLFSIKYGTDEKVNYYLSSMDEHGVEMECVTNNIEKIYQKMASPIQMLDTLRYELNNR